MVSPKYHHNSYFPYQPYSSICCLTILYSVSHLKSIPISKLWSGLQYLSQIAFEAHNYGAQCPTKSDFELGTLTRRNAAVCASKGVAPMGYWRTECTRDTPNRSVRKITLSFPIPEEDLCALFESKLCKIFFYT